MLTVIMQYVNYIFNTQSLIYVSTLEWEHMFRIRTNNAKNTYSVNITIKYDVHYKAISDFYLLLVQEDSMEI